MTLAKFPVRAQVGVADIGRAVEFYEGQLGLTAVRSGPSADIVDGVRVYGADAGTMLIVYQTSARSPSATVATWFVEDIKQVVAELASRGVEFVRYDEFEHQTDGITDRAGGGYIAWLQDPDGNTFSIEADS